jgi:type IX secretion system substrate protein
MKQKYLLRFVFFLLFLTSLTMEGDGQGTGYIRTEGNQFKDENGDPFYSVCMTYPVNMMMYFCPPPGEPAYHVAPIYDFGSTPYPCFECATASGCLSKIQDDFDNIKAMGFNTVHVSGLCPVAEKNPNDSLNYFYVTLFAIDKEWHHNDYHVLSSPLSADTIIPEIFQAINNIAAAADSAGLKLIIDGEVGHVWATPTFQDLYTEYLGLLATYINANNIPLMAYFITGEPKFNSLDLNSTNTKMQVCEATNDWYHALKDIDTNHLVGCGMLGLENLFTWDPGVQKMDFLQPHVYLGGYRDYEDAGMPGNRHNLPEAMDRINAQLYWFKNNSPVPWMVGETGFNTYEPNGYVSPACTSLCCPGTPLACDTPKVDCSGTGWTPAVFDGDATHPNYFDQQDYYADNLEMVRNCGAQGYAVWEYQDGLSADCSNKFGLLYNGNTDPANLTNLLKPAAAEFTNYLDAHGQPPPAVPLTAPPNNYYDPMHTAYYLNLSCSTCGITPIAGTVTDQNGNHIKDAFLRAHVYRSTGIDQNQQPYPIDNVFYTFTDASGDFTLTPFDPDEPSVSWRQYIRWLEVTSIGSSNVDSGSYSAYWPFSTYQISTGQTYQLTKIDLNLHETVENQTVDAGNSPVTFEAWRTLTVTTNNTVDSGGIADFKALDEVHVESEFHAENGSEVHIYNETVQLKCSDITDQGGFRMADHNTPPSSQQEKLMELIFRKKNLPEAVAVFPNPNSGIFTLNYTGDSDVKQINVYDIIGNIIISGNFTGNETELNLTIQPKGIYFLNIKSKTKSFNLKIIIQ